MKIPHKTTLITVLGSSPQVMTETLYALKDKSFPQRIIIFTTLHGAEQIKKLKVSDKIKSLCEHYSLPLPTLLDSDIKIVKDLHGSALNDIRNNSDQEAMADQITETVRELVKDDSSALHASIAGGRKSMSFYMGYIFSIFARPCDTLSHVLVAPEFESNNFWFPTKNSSEFIARKDWTTGKEIKLDAKDGVVELAEIPFLRINNALSRQGDMLTQNASYRETLDAYQLSLSPENIQLEFTNDYRVLLNDNELDLPIDTIAFYRIIAKNCLASPIYKRTNIRELEAPLLRELAQISGTNLEGAKLIDKLDEIEDDLQDQAGYTINKKVFRSIEEKNLTTTVSDRMMKDISLALKKVAIGQTVSFCEACIVKSELSESGLRNRTKGGYLGLQLNPKQIQFS
jgi:CRISPR-associated protein (TIGR02584 family)